MKNRDEGVQGSSEPERKNCMEKITFNTGVRGM
jgi:hypothetical protein